MVRGTTGDHSCRVCFSATASMAGSRQPPAKIAFASDAKASPSLVMV